MDELLRSCGLEVFFFLLFSILSCPFTSGSEVFNGALFFEKETPVLILHVIYDLGQMYMEMMLCLLIWSFVMVG